MAARKVYDLALKVGEYEKNGEKKARYKNIGRVLEKDDGGRFILLDATILSMPVFALVNKERKDEVIVSMFEPKDQPSGQTDHGKAKSNGYQGQDDDEPF